MPILEWENLLVQSSQAHCIDMAEKGYFAHNSFDGTTHKDRNFSNRYTRYFVAWGVVQYCSWTSVSLVDTFDLWVNSLGHRANMLS